MRVLIIGASGLLGNALLRAWSARKGWRVSGTFREHALPQMTRLDLRDRAGVEEVLARARPDWVALPASNPHVDYCESHPEETRLLNVDATMAAAEASIEAGARLLFFSTDYVFDGARGGYRETDATRPLSEYGRQKLAVERGLEGFGDRVLTLRTSALFGWELRPKNFALQVLARLGRGERMKVASDQDYNPTYCPDIADAAGDLIERGASGLLHACGARTLTRAAFAGKIAEAFGLDRALLTPVPLRELAAPGSAPRPAHSALATDKARKLLGRPFWGAERALEHMKGARREWDSAGAAA